jgi:transcriptional regulator GlxA family with amidase domain
MSLRKVVLVVTDGMQLLDVVGPSDMLDAATRLLGGEVGYSVAIASPDGRPVRGSGGLRLGADTSVASLRRRGVDTLIVGGGMDIPHAPSPSPVRHALERLGGATRRTGSVCTGAFLLADAGLLDGREATTHWAFCAELARRHPTVRVSPDRIFVRDGHIYTSAGVTAGMDLALALIEEDHGPRLARAVARWTVMFLQRPGGQSQFSERLALPAGIEGTVRTLVDEIVADPAGVHSQARLARRACVSERHLRRLFATRAGMTPGRFVERVRVEAACNLLESSATPIDAIARHCGFGSSETMRRAFIRVLGVGPAAYRERFREAATIPAAA